MATAKSSFPNQAAAFLGGAGDDYYQRNRADFGKHDLVMDVLEAGDVRPTTLLEVGCANGWRLERFRERHPECSIRGIEPSEQAVKDGNAVLGAGILRQGVAEDLSAYNNGVFDVVIYGFCLWLCDPRHHFRIVAEGDRVLKDGGYLVVHDYLPPRAWRSQYAPPEASDREKQLWGWVHDYAKLWLAHPMYHHIAERMRMGKTALEIAVLLRKGITAGFPELLLEA